MYLITRSSPASEPFFFFQAEDGIRDKLVTGVQTCALPICGGEAHPQTRESSQCRAGEGTRGQVEEVSPREIHAAYPVLPSCSSLSMIVASTRGSSVTV